MLFFHCLLSKPPPQKKAASCNLCFAECAVISTLAFTRSIIRHYATHDNKNIVCMNMNIVGGEGSLHPHLIVQKCP